MRTRGFIHGSIFMVMINLIVRTIDFTYNVMLSKYIGAEGLGLFHMVKSIMMIFIVISTAGIPTAIARLVAEYKSKKDPNSIRKILQVSVTLALSFGIIFSIIILLFGDEITTRLYKNELIIPAIYFLIPSVILLPLTITSRGYYYGLRIITVPNVSNIIEHVGQFIIVYIMLNLAYPMSPITGATIAVCGTAIGEVFDLIYLTSMLKKANRGMAYIPSKKVSSLKILKEIFSISSPIAIGDFISVILRFANSIFIPRRLMDIGFSNSEAVSTLGRISGMAMPLISLTFIVTGAIATNIVPNLSENIALKRYDLTRRNIIFSIKMTLLAAIPLTGIYLFYSYPLGYYIFKDYQVGKFIRLMAFGTIFSSLEHTFSGVLNGLNKQIAATKNRLIGLSVQVLCIYSLVGHPKFGVNGFFIGFLVSSIVIFILDGITIRRKVKLSIDFKDIVLKPVLATIIMIITISISIDIIGKFIISKSISFFLSLAIGGISYLIVIILTKAIPRHIIRR